MSVSLSLNQQIFRTLMVVGVSSVLPKVALVLRDLLMASHYGTNHLVDSFMVALSLPTLTVQILVQAFASTLIPVFMRVQQADGPLAAQRLSGRACTYGLLFLIALSFAMLLGGAWIVPLLCPGFTPDKQALALEFFYLLVPLVIVQGYTIIGSALLNAMGKFALTTLLPCLSPLLMLAAFLMPTADHSIKPLVWAILLGGTIEALITMRLLRRQAIPLWQSDHVRQLLDCLYEAAPMILGMALINANLLVNQSFASLHGEGGVSALAYAYKVPAFLLSLAAMPVGTAVLPHFSKHAVLKDWVGLKKSLYFWSFVSFVIMSIMIIVLFFMSDDVVKILFQRGNFSSEDSSLVSKIQIVFLFQMPAYMIGYIGSKMITSIGKNNYVLFIQIACFFVNIISVYILFELFGLPGIAAASVVTYSASAFGIFCYLTYDLSARARHRT